MTETKTTTDKRVGEIQKFWRHLFGGERGLLQVWTVKRDASGNTSDETIASNNFAYPRAAENAAAWALAKAEQGREVYFCTHLLTRSKRVKENAAPVRTLWGDLDGAEIPNGNLKPTAVVESSPGRYHAYWRLEDAIPPEIAEQLNLRIAREIKADPSGFDLSQLLRVPWTVNHKYEDKAAVRLVGLDGTRSYSAAELDEMLPKIELPTHEPSADDGGEPPIVLTPEALKVWRGEKPKLKDNGKIDRSATLLNIGRVLFDAGANRRVVVEGVRERDKALGLNKYSDNRDGGLREYERIWEKLEEDGRNSRLRIIFGDRKDKPEDPPEADENSWPELADEALYGLPGDIVRAIEPQTEAHPVALLANTLVAFGNASGIGAYVQVGPDMHNLNLDVVLVGETAKGRKGTSWGYVRNFYKAVDPSWIEERVMNGLSSGEGLIYAVRDYTMKKNKKGEEVLEDEGVLDKRLLVHESEFASTLKVANREGNTLSVIIRQAWDGEKLQTLTRNSPMKATGAHVSIIGHITRTELLRHLNETESANGFANRMIWLMVRRSKELPFGGEWRTEDAAPLVKRLKSALGFASSSVEICWSKEAKEIWRRVYGPLSEGKPGLFGAVTGRAEAQVVRLAALYAAMDESEHIRASHLEAALALWEYAEASARYIFGDATGDHVADQITEALKANPGGLKKTEISAIFGRHKTADEINRALTLLQKAGRIRREEETTSGRTAEKWFAA